MLWEKRMCIYVYLHIVDYFSCFLKHGPSKESSEPAMKKGFQAKKKKRGIKTRFYDYHN